MSEQERHEQSAQFFWGIFLPAVLLVVVLFGFPWIGMKITDYRDSIRHKDQATPSAPAVERPSPPASGTGPPVAGDGGETG